MTPRGAGPRGSHEHGGALGGPWGLVPLGDGESVAPKGGQAGEP